MIKAILILLIFASVSYAYTIGGAYASLQSCEYKQWGYEYGYVGVYETNNQLITLFFGNDYCPY